VVNGRERSGTYEMFNEVEKERVLARVVEWMDARVEGSL
jgi:hypothetical protein